MRIQKRFTDHKTYENNIFAMFSIRHIDIKFEKGITDLGSGSGVVINVENAGSFEREGKLK